MNPFPADAAATRRGVFRSAAALAGLAGAVGAAPASGSGRALLAGLAAGAGDRRGRVRRTHRRGRGLDGRSRLPLGDVLAEEIGE